MELPPVIILHKASDFMIKAHQGQTRKDGTTPYCAHPLRVYSILHEHGASHTELFCGLWHDILEDCRPREYYYDTMHSEMMLYGFPMTRIDEVMKILDALDKPVTGSREERLNTFLDNIIACGSSAVFIKICDRIDNVLDANGLGKFAEEYVVTETKQVMNVLTRYAASREHPDPRIKYALSTLSFVRSEFMKERGFEEG